MPISEFTAEEIRHSERKRLEQSLLVTLFVASTIFSISGGSWYYLFASSIAIGINLVAVHKAREIYVGRLFVHLGVFVAICLVFVELIRIRGIHPRILGHFVILLQLCKLFDRKKTRDYVQLLLLSLLLIIVTAYECAEFWFLPAIIIYLFSASYTSMILTIKRGQDVAIERSLKSRESGQSGSQISWNVTRRWPGMALWRTICAMLLPSLMMAVLSFFFLPRLSGGIPVDGLGNNGQGNILPRDIHLGRTSRIYQSSAIVMRVGVEDKGVKGSARHASSRYMRGYVLDKYSNSRWSSESRRPRPIRMVRPFRDRGLSGSGVTHVIDMEPGTGPVLPVPYATYYLSYSPDLEIKRSEECEYLITTVGSGYRPMSIVTRSFPLPLTSIQRDVIKQIQPAFSPPDVRPSAIARNQITRFARKLCGDLLEKRRALIEKRAGLIAELRRVLNQDQNVLQKEIGRLNLEIGRRIAAMLRSNYQYTLDLSDSDPSQDGVVDFLFHMKKGHCEYFASSMAVMCAMVKVPCRVAIGYVLREYDGEAKEYIVRAKNAHAWCEVYSPQTGWLPIDPTAAGITSEHAEGGFWSSVGDFFRGMTGWWDRGVVSYSYRDQRELKNYLRSEAGSLWERVGAVWRNAWESIEQFFSSGIINSVFIRTAIFSIVLIALIMVVVRMVVRALSRAAKNKSVDPRRLVFLEKLFALLEKKGMDVRPGDTLRMKACFAESGFGLSSDKLQDLVNLQYRWRWGDVPPDDEELSAARNLVEEMIVFLRKPV